MDFLRKLKKYLPWGLVLVSCFILFAVPIGNLAAVDTTSSTGNCPTGLIWNASSGLCMPQAGASTGIAGSQDLGSLITNILKILLYVSGALAVVFIVIGGYQYVTSGGNEEAAEKGKKTLINSVIGLVVIILAYTIVTVVANTLTKSVG